jgi:hypothetical protein
LGVILGDFFHELIWPLAICLDFNLFSRHPSAETQAKKMNFNQFDVNLLK